MRFLLVTIALLTQTALSAAGSYQLVPWEGSLPDDAVQGGETSDGKPLYICVSSRWGGGHPGKLDEDGICHVAWGGQGHAEEEFEVLTGSPAEGDWEQMPDGVKDTGVPDNAFVAGDDGGPIYICRVEEWGGRHPGKLVDDGWCYVAHDGEEHYFPEDYEILVE